MKGLRGLAWMILGVVVACAPLGVLAQSNAAKKVGNNSFTLNLKDADINTLIATVSEVTGRNFVVDPRVKGKVTVISQQPMTPGELYQTFLSVLHVHGYAAIPAGDVIKIVTQVEAKQNGQFGGGPSSGPSGGQSGGAEENIVTKVIHVDNVPVTQLVPLLRPLIPQSGQLAADEASRSLIISDRKANVTRITRIVHRLDQNGMSNVQQIRLQQANAQDVAEAIQKLNGNGGSQGSAKNKKTGGSANVVALKRTNSVLISGTPHRRQQLRQIIRNMDTKSAELGDTAVIYLNYADAETLAPVLQAFATGKSYSSGAARSTSLNTGSGFGSFGGSGSYDNGYGNNSGFGGFGGGRNRGLGGRSLNRGNNNDNTQAISGQKNDSGISVIAVAASNSLIIHAPADKMAKIKQVISKLDVRRGQVLVEGIIAEISLQRSRKLGINIAALKDNGPAVASVLNPNTLASVGQAVSMGTPLGLIQQGLNVALASNNGSTNFALLVNALSNNTDTNVLSTPSLITRDNEEAQITVGKRVPFVTGSYTNGNTGGNGGLVQRNSIDRRTVGLQLAFVPQISAGDTIQLTLNEEVSSIAPSAQQSSQAPGLITNSRTLQTAVEVKNGEILVLGGLIDNNLNVTHNQVPVLGDIPLIGALFHYNSVNRSKRNLLNFIRPTILRGDSESRQYSINKYKYLRALQEQQSKRKIPLMGNAKRPQLPAIQNFNGGTNASARFNNTGHNDLGQPRRSPRFQRPDSGNKRRGDQF